MDMEAQQHITLHHGLSRKFKVQNIQWFARTGGHWGGYNPARDMCNCPETWHDKIKKELNIFELTCPLERNIDERHLFKQNKYAHFCSDITTFKTKVTAFEVSSRGFLSQSNLKNIHSLHKFCKAGTKLSTFKKNISSLSIYSSYHIWLCRSDPIFIQPPYLKPTFHD